MFVRWDANDYKERKVNFYSKYGARLNAEYKQVLQEEEEKQDTVRGLTNPSLEGVMTNQSTI